MDFIDLLAEGLDEIIPMVLIIFGGFKDDLSETGFLRYLICF